MYLIKILSKWMCFYQFAFIQGPLQWLQYKDKVCEGGEAH